MKASEFIKNVRVLSEDISSIRRNNYNRKKNEKENFNFFSAIVSGKNSRDHIEKYHSNFIAYLLDKRSQHDFDTLFNEYFFKVLRDSFCIKNLPECCYLNVEREKKTDNGRFIDISLEDKNEWIVFIENKIRSGEQKDQMKDYCNFVRDKYRNKIGIYLTLFGDSPDTINLKEAEENGITLIILSYKHIIEWLELCCKTEKIIKHHHVLSALKQYIQIIKNLINNMEEEMQDMLNYLLENKSITSEIASNLWIFNNALNEVIKKVREKFLYDLNIEVSKLIDEKNISDNIKIRVHQGDYSFSGNEDKSFGLGFEIYKNGERYNYGGNGYGGCGNAIFINEINAHYGDGIDKTNGLLISMYNNAQEWNQSIELTAELIINEVIQAVDLN